MTVPPKHPGVFISYCASAGGEGTAGNVHNLLEAEGVNAFFYPKDAPPAADWRKEVRAEIAACDLVVVLVTQRPESDNVSDEVAYARKRPAPTNSKLGESELALPKPVIWMAATEALKDALVGQEVYRGLFDRDETTVILYEMKGLAAGVSDCLEKLAEVTKHHLKVPAPGSWAAQHVGTRGEFRLLAPAAMTPYVAVANSYRFPNPPQERRSIALADRGSSIASLGDGTLEISDFSTSGQLSPRWKLDGSEITGLCALHEGEVSLLVANTVDGWGIFEVHPEGVAPARSDGDAEVQLRAAAITGTHRFLIDENCQLIDGNDVLEARGTKVGHDWIDVDAAEACGIGVVAALCQDSETQILMVAELQDGVAVAPTEHVLDSPADSVRVVRVPLWSNAPIEKLVLRRGQSIEPRDLAEFRATTP